MTTTGNTVAVALSKASQEPDSRESQCKEMAKRNEENRKNAPGKLEATKQNEHRKSYVDKIDESLDKLDGGGMTFASAFVDVGIGGGERLRGMMSACSDAKTQECLQDALVPGGTDEMRAGTQTILCEDAAYAHPGGGFGSHAEAKILNEVTSMAKGRNLAGAPSCSEPTGTMTARKGAPTHQACRARSATVRCARQPIAGSTSTFATQNRSRFASTPTETARRKRRKAILATTPGTGWTGPWARTL